MSYDPKNDFLALARNAPSGVRIARLPGLDFFVEAMACAGMITLVVGQAAPTVSQATTVWFKPAIPSWSDEGQVFLWNGTDYVPATPALWRTILSP